MDSSIGCNREDHLGRWFQVGTNSGGGQAGKVIFVISTDGLENSSREFTKQKVKELIKHQQEKYGWEFIFLGANINAVKEAGSIGIHKDYAFNYVTSEAGIKEMYDIVNDSVSKLRQGDVTNK